MWPESEGSKFQQCINTSLALLLITVVKVSRNNISNF